MKERPILFSAPMVRGILAGTKVQTRRVVKPQAMGQWGPVVPCPYGQPGDRLWVREAWDFIPEGDPGTPSCAGIRYWADAGYELRTPPSNYNPMLYGKERVRPSIHMPRWASRITLEVTGVRVERLQDISEADARAEGISRADCPDWHATTDYRALWESIHGPGSWAANPWVWVVEFKRVG
jgi:hypothetical protein